MRRGHVAADAQVLVMQAHAKSGRILSLRHEWRPVNEIPAGSCALAKRLDHFFQRQAFSFCKCHGFGYRLDNPGTHDLVRGLGRLASAAGPEVGDCLAELLEHWACAIEDALLATGHHRECAEARPLDATTDRAVEKSNLLLREQ